MVVPTGKVDPDAKFEVKLTTAELSVAVGSIQVTICEQAPGAAGGASLGPGPQARACTCAGPRVQGGSRGDPESGL